MSCRMSTACAKRGPRTSVRQDCRLHRCPPMCFGRRAEAIAATSSAFSSRMVYDIRPDGNGVRLARGSSHLACLPPPAALPNTNQIRAHARPGPRIAWHQTWDSCWVPKRSAHQAALREFRTSFRDTTRLRITAMMLSGSDLGRPSNALVAAQAEMSFLTIGRENASSRRALLARTRKLLQNWSKMAPRSDSRLMVGEFSQTWPI